MSGDNERTVAVVEPPEQQVSRVQRPALTNPAIRRQVVDELEAQVLLIREAMDRTLKPDVHYGRIPGTQRPSLWQPGAEMLCQMFQFQTRFERTGAYEDWEQGIFAYTYKCYLADRNGTPVSEREGTCSTEEDKYKSQHVERVVGNRTLRAIRPAEQREVIMQMAQKRAYVAVVRGSAAASAIFSQDDELVPEESTGSRARRTSYGRCERHNEAYFMRGKMTRPAHKYEVDGETRWCNKPDAPAEPEPQDEAPASPEAATAQGRADAARGLRAEISKLLDAAGVEKMDREAVVRAACDLADIAPRMDEDGSFNPMILTPEELGQVKGAVEAHVKAAMEAVLDDRAVEAMEDEQDADR